LLRGFEETKTLCDLFAAAGLRVVIDQNRVFALFHSEKAQAADCFV